MMQNLSLKKNPSNKYELNIENFCDVLMSLDHISSWNEETYSWSVSCYKSQIRTISDRLVKKVFFFYLICILSCLIDRVSDYREMVCMTDYARRFFPYLYPNLQNFVFNCYIILLAAFFQSQMETKSHTKKYSFWITVNDNRTGKFTVKFQKIIWFFKIKYICLA